MSRWSPPKVPGPERARVSLVSLGVGLAAAGIGAAIGVAAERVTTGHPLAGRRVPSDGEDYGGLRVPGQVVVADDGTRLHVEVEEPPPGEDVPVTLVFCHGYTLSQDAWHFQRKMLREIEDRRLAGTRFRMVFWDQRGHGRSQFGDPAAATLDQLGSDLERVIQAVAPTGPLVLIGHSMGGMTVMALARRRPDLMAERVIAVALVSTSAGGLDGVDLGLPRLSASLLRFAEPTLQALIRTPRLVERTRQAASDLETVVLRRYSYASPVSPALAEFTAAMITATRLDVVSAFLTALLGHDELEALAAFDGVETLVISGDKDLLTPAEHSDEIARRLPNAEHVVVADSGHMTLLEHPEIVDEHLIDLMERAIRSHRDAEAAARPARRGSAIERPGPLGEGHRPVTVGGLV